MFVVTIPQISSTFGKIPREFLEKFGTLSNFWGLRENFGNSIKISGIWIEIPVDLMSIPVAGLNV